MNRKEFISTTGLLSLTAVLPSQSVLAQPGSGTGIDQLMDKEGRFVHLALPYSETFLEPYMDAETLHLHYTYHHGGAVKAANDDLAHIRKALEENRADGIDYWTRKLSYHFSSHVLHTIFWTNLGNRRAEPAGDLLRYIEKSFGSYEKLKLWLAKVALEVDGNGWGILGYQPYTDRLTVLACENHEKLTQWGVIPLLVIDVWEHAYYLKHRNRRGDFISTLLQIIRWDNVADRLNTALKMTGREGR